MAAFVLVGVLGALTGCGSTHTASSPTVVTIPPSSPPQASTVASTPTQTATTSAPPEAGGQPTLGAITATNGHGTAIKQEYRLGPPLYGNTSPPPAEALEACNANSPELVASSVFASGEDTVRYTEGSLPIQVHIDPVDVASAAVRGETAATRVPFSINGRWQCDSSSQEMTVTLQPGQNTTYPIWVIIENAMSNQHPHVGASELHEWEFTGGGIHPETDFLETRHSTGPNATGCQGQGGVLLFAKGTGDSAQCK
jgi:hypothetical protein